MSDIAHIPMFPLAILPLPGELVPLHIFEPRYQQLLQDAEINDLHFGIYFSHECNEQKIGSLMKLESIIKRYPAGEADIIVKCEDIFDLKSLARTYKTKLYPGGDARFWNIETSCFPGPELYDLFPDHRPNLQISCRKSDWPIIMRRSTRPSCRLTSLHPSQ